MIKKIILGVVILVVIVIVAAFLSVFYNRILPPPKLVANFVDVKKIKEISTYRSCAGHTTVPQDMGEMKRNMKHYIKVYPEYKKEKAVELYSPYDGRVAVMRADMADKLEGELWIAPDRGILSILPPFGLWMFSFEHMQPRPDLKYGTKVKAGELIGYASFLITERDATFDAIYGKIGIPTKIIDNWNSPFSDLDSVFSHMTDRVLGEYRQRGITPEKVIVTKEERDNNPCTYRDQGPYFIDHDDPKNWVSLK